MIIFRNWELLVQFSITLFQSQTHQSNDNKIKLSINSVECKLINKCKLLHVDREENETEEWQLKLLRAYGG